MIADESSPGKRFAGRAVEVAAREARGVDPEQPKSGKNRQRRDDWLENEEAPPFQPRHDLAHRGGDPEIAGIRKKAVRMPPPSQMMRSEYAIRRRVSSSAYTFDLQTLVGRCSAVILRKPRVSGKRRGSRPCVPVGKC